MWIYSKPQPRPESVSQHVYSLLLAVWVRALEWYYQAIQLCKKATRIGHPWDCIFSVLPLSWREDYGWLVLLRPSQVPWSYLWSSEDDQYSLAFWFRSCEGWSNRNRWRERLWIFPCFCLLKAEFSEFRAISCSTWWSDLSEVYQAVAFRHQDSSQQWLFSSNWCPKLSKLPLQLQVKESWRDSISNFLHLLMKVFPFRVQQIYSLSQSQCLYGSSCKGQVFVESTYDRPTCSQFLR